MCHVVLDLDRKEFERSDSKRALLTLSILKGIVGLSSGEIRVLPGMCPAAGRAEGRLAKKTRPGGEGDWSLICMQHMRRFCRKPDLNVKDGMSLACAMLDLGFLRAWKLEEMCSQKQRQQAG